MMMSGQCSDDICHSSSTVWWLSKSGRQKTNLVGTAKSVDEHHPPSIIEQPSIHQDDHVHIIQMSAESGLAWVLHLSDPEIYSWLPEICKHQGLH